MHISSNASADGVDAIAILRADHARVSKLLKKFRRLHFGGALVVAEKLAREICVEWTIHTTIEAEIFYPEARAVIDDAPSLADANADRTMGEELIAQIVGGSIGDDKYATRVGMLAEFVNHHIRQEQQELFPRVRDSGLELGEIGARMLARRLDLEADAAATTALRAAG